MAEPDRPQVQHRPSTHLLLKCSKFPWGGAPRCVLEAGQGLIFLLHLVAKSGACRRLLGQDLSVLILPGQGRGRGGGASKRL